MEEREGEGRWREGGRCSLLHECGVDERLGAELRDGVEALIQEGGQGAA